MENFLSTSDNPHCRTTAVSKNANGTGACHREGLGAARVFTGNTVPLDPIRFDHLLVFTGKETLNVSSQVQVTSGGFFQQASVSTSNHHRLAADLFMKYSDHSLDIGADHAWVDDTGLDKCGSSASALEASASWRGWRC